ncbi:MAG: FecR domain-containing protein [Betaproteobacteria bacterium]|nr:FecR domain-containing protein [Betaproteobacteria bacterium]
MRQLLAACAACFLCLGLAQAAPTAVVEGVQMPAWLERYGRLQPIAPGMELRASDTVRTGRNARILLKLAEGSLVRLGENGQLKLTSLNESNDGKSVFRAAFEVLRGAFRFTTDRIAAPRQRDVQVKIASITAGVRGTDLWGKAAADRDLVCLIEGRISVAREGSPEISMSDPLSFYVAPKGAAPEPVQAVPLAKLAQWAQETDLAAGQGAAQQGGAWHLMLAEGRDQGPALDVYIKLRTAGYAARIETVGKGAQFRYQVRLPQIADEAGAQALAARLASELGVPGAKVFK